MARPMEQRLDLLAAERGWLPRRVAAFASRLRSENGTTLIELMTAMALLGIVMAGVTTAMGSATRAESDLERRFTAQQTARLALTTIRSDLRCAASVTPASGATSSVTLTIPTGCKAAAGSTTWCTASSGAGLYGLWRIPGTSCSTTAAGSRLWAEDLRSPTVFTPDASIHAGAPTLPSVAIDLSVASGTRSYKAADRIYLRNGVRQ